MVHKVLLKKNSNTLSVEDKQILDTYGKNVDFTDIEFWYDIYLILLAKI